MAAPISHHPFVNIRVYSRIDYPARSSGATLKITWKGMQ